MPVVATNTSANTALNYLNRNSFDQSKSLAKLSSGSRIVSASDDAAGLAVASRLSADISVLEQGSRNVLQARAVLQTADGALSNIGDILQRMKSLAAQAVSGSVSDAQRAFIDAEYQQLIVEVNSIESSTTFNVQPLIDVSFTGAIADFLVGPDATNDRLNANLVNVDADVASLFGAAAGNLLTSGAAVAQANLIDTGIDAISTDRSDVGSLISRFEFRGDYIATALENLQAARSSILDVDIAAEQSNLVAKQVLTETSIAALAQANQMKQSLLSLVR
jgi:flagellin